MATTAVVGLATYGALWYNESAVSERLRSTLPRTAEETSHRLTKLAQSMIGYTTTTLLGSVFSAGATVLSLLEGANIALLFPLVSGSLRSSATNSEKLAELNATAAKINDALPELIRLPQSQRVLSANELRSLEEQFRKEQGLYGSTLSEEQFQEALREYQSLSYDTSVHNGLWYLGAGLGAVNALAHIVAPIFGALGISATLIGLESLAEYAKDSVLPQPESSSALKSEEDDNKASSVSTRSVPEHDATPENNPFNYLRVQNGGRAQDTRVNTEGKPQVRASRNPFDDRYVDNMGITLPENAMLDPDEGPLDRSSEG